jgi:hypothetical protein
MRFWARLALVVWLLTGLLSAPAMAFGMTCHGGMDSGAMVSDMPMTMPVTHKSMPNTAKDMEQKAFACAVHCLSAGAGFTLPSADHASLVVAGSTLLALPTTSLNGLSVGPPLEPPIRALV